MTIFLYICTLLPHIWKWWARHALVRAFDERRWCIAWDRGKKAMAWTETTAEITGGKGDFVSLRRWRVRVREQWWAYGGGLRKARGRKTNVYIMCVCRDELCTQGRMYEVKGWSTEGWLCGVGEGTKEWRGWLQRKSAVSERDGSWTTYTYIIYSVVGGVDAIQLHAVSSFSI